MCSSVLDAMTCPRSSMMTARVPPVPTSIPRNLIFPPIYAAPLVRTKDGSEVVHDLLRQLLLSLNREAGLRNRSVSPGLPTTHADAILAYGDYAIPRFIHCA